MPLGVVEQGLNDRDQMHDLQIGRSFAYCDIVAIYALMFYVLRFALILRNCYFFGKTETHESLQIISVKCKRSLA